MQLFPKNISSEPRFWNENLLAIHQIIGDKKYI